MKGSLTHRIYERLNKPEYWFQPRQVLCKLGNIFGRTPHQATVRLPWGIDFEVRTHETIGMSLLTYGVYELAVSEVLWRLTDPGDWCLDVGANIGYMAGLFAVKAGPLGRVFAFEPHPKVFARLEVNVGRSLALVGAQGHAPVTLRQHAVGATASETDLVEPEGFDENEGTAALAHVASPFNEQSVRHRVLVRPLDAVFAGEERFGVMKVDVEGAELAVFQGAGRLLEQRRMRDIVFEDFQPFPSECVTLLKRAGYAIRRIGKAIRGPVTWDPADVVAGRQALRWEPVNYLATQDLKRAEDRLRPRGWQCLRAVR